MSRAEDLRGVRGLPCVGRGAVGQRRQDGVKDRADEVDRMPVWSRLRHRPKCPLCAPEAVRPKQDSDRRLLAIERVLPRIQSPWSSGGAAPGSRLCGLWNRRGLEHTGPLFDTPQRFERHREVLA